MGAGVRIIGRYSDFCVLWLEAGYWELSVWSFGKGKAYVGVELIQTVYGEKSLLDGESEM